MAQMIEILKNIFVFILGIGGLCFAFSPALIIGGGFLYLTLYWNNWIKNRIFKESKNE